jgi:WD40 repeat protein
MAVAPIWTAPGGGRVALSADGSYVLADGDSFSLYSRAGDVIWRGFGGSSMQAGSEIASPLALTADGMYAILATNSGLSYVDRSQRVFWQDSAYHPVDDLALSPDENFVASVADGRVSIYTRGGDLVWQNSTYTDVKVVGISRDGLLTVAGSPDVIHAYNQTGYEIWNYSAPGIRSVLVSPGNSDIIAVSDYMVLSLHPSGNLLWKFYTGDEVRDIALSADGSSIAAGNQGGRLVLLDRDGNLVWSFTAGNWINAVSLSRDGSLVAAGGIDRNVYLFDRSGRQIFTYTTLRIVQCVAVSPDGSALAASSDRVYYFDLGPGGAGETPTIPSLTATAPPATPAPASTPTPPAPMETPGGSVPATTAPATTETPRSGSEYTALAAAGIAGLGYILRRVR